MKITIEIEDGVSCEIKSDAISLDEVLELIGQALRGVGFNFNGSIGIIDDEC